MIISSRLSRILKICLQRDIFITADELASMLQISKRTVFRELQDIEYYVSSYSLTLTSKPKKGILIEGNEEDKQKLLRDLQIEKVDYVNKEERRNLLIFEILREKDTQKLYYYANQFQVSESTISNDLDEIDAWFQKYDLKIERTPGLGISLVGKESDYRKALTDIISQSLQENTSYEKGNPHDALYLLENVFLHDQDGIMKILNQEILKRVLQVFEKYQHELHLDQYAQSSYIGLIIHLTIAIERIIRKESMEESGTVIEMVQNTPSFVQAQTMATYLEEEFEIAIPNAEIAFISMHLQGAKPIGMQDSDHTNTQEDTIKQFVETLLQEVDQRLQTNLYLDEELRCGLMVHLKPAFVRLTHNMRIYNPLLTQIKNDYMPIYEACRQACESWKTHFGKDIPEDEIGYIAMHFGAAMERAERNAYQMRNVKVGIVCSSGIGVSALLLARVKKSVDANVQLVTLSLEEASQQTQIELYISTFTFASSVPTIVVNPLLDQEDVKQIKESIKRIREKPMLHVEENKSKNKVISSLDEDIFTLLDTISLELCEPMDSKQMIDYIAALFGKDNEAVQQIKQALESRERVCSSIYPEVHFAIFHASLPCIEECTCKVLRAKETLLDDMQEIDFVVAMFMPKESTCLQKQMMSIINRTIMEEDSFFATLANGDEKEIYNAIENLMKDFLFTTLKENRGMRNEK